MKNAAYILLALVSLPSIAQPSGSDLMNLIDRNLSARTRIMTGKMIVSGVRGSRTMEFNAWTEGDKRSFTEYTAPAREKGTKMLKLEDKLWIFSPSTDRIIQITGQMLRQSVMGSDLSYEDMMTDQELKNHYSATVTGTDTLQGRKCWLLKLEAKTDNEAYQVRVLKVDQEKYVPLSEELFAKSGKLLKRIILSDVRKVEGRWYPMKMVYKDMLKSGEGTQFVTLSLRLDEPVPENTFSKSSLK